MPPSLNRTREPGRRGFSPLALAWLLLLAVAAPIATYVILVEQRLMADLQPAVALVVAPEEEIAAPIEEAAEEESPAAAIENDPAAPAEQVAPPSPDALEEEEALPRETAALEPPPAAPAAEATLSSGSDGAEMPPWRRYAAVYDRADSRPRIAVVLTGLGLSANATEKAILKLPPAVSLSFTPYAKRLDHWMALARVNGHEVMLDLPMEPRTYPNDDPGPQTLLTHLDVAENQQRLRWILGRAEGYVGLAAVKGSRFSGSEPDLKPILREIRDRGLLFVDNRTNAESVAARVARDLRLPHAVNDRTLDDGEPSHVAIDARLVQTERLARTTGAAVVMGQPYPVTIERLRDWIRGLESRDFILVPITAIAETR